MMRAGGKNLRARLPFWFAPALALLLGFGGVLRVTFAEHPPRPAAAAILIAVYALVGLAGVVSLLVRAARGSIEKSS
jgi:hypothetical protein